MIDSSSRLYVIVALFLQPCEVYHIKKAYLDILFRSQLLQ